MKNEAGPVADRPLALPFAVPESRWDDSAALGRTLLTDGPFVDSKDFLGGFIIVEAENLDGALAVAGELQELQGAGAIEVRPVREEPLIGA